MGGVRFALGVGACPLGRTPPPIPAAGAAGAAGFGVGERLLAGADPRSASAIGERLHAALSVAGGGAY